MKKAKWLTLCTYLAVINDQLYMTGDVGESVKSNFKHYAPVGERYMDKLLGYSVQTRGQETLLLCSD